MDHVLTGGRYPSYGLVREYYARSDFLGFLRRVAARRQVVLVIPRERHWQPGWQEDRVQADTEEQARVWLLGRLDEAFPDADPEARLPFYPSLHQSLEERVVRPDGSAVTGWARHGSTSRLSRCSRICSRVRQTGRNRRRANRANWSPRCGESGCVALP